MNQYRKRNRDDGGHLLLLHTTGCSPARAAPTARPQNPCSVIGVSMTLLGPKRSSRPRVTLYLQHQKQSGMRLNWKRNRHGRKGQNIRSIVLRNLLSQDESLLVAFQLLRKGLIQCITNGDLFGASFRSIPPGMADRRNTESWTERIRNKAGRKQASCWAEKSGRSHDGDRKVNE